MLTISEIQSYTHFEFLHMAEDELGPAYCFQHECSTFLLYIFQTQISTLYLSDPNSPQSQDSISWYSQSLPLRPSLFLDGSTHSFSLWSCWSFTCNLCLQCYHLDRYLHQLSTLYLYTTSWVCYPFLRPVIQWLLSLECFSVSSFPNKAFPFNCATYFYLTFVGNKYVLLMAMGYDHYIAIYNPLWYSVIMGKKTCIQLANISWSIGQSTANIQVSSVFSLPFCDTNIISCIFCDIWPSVKLFCADITIKKCITLFINLCVLGLTMILIFISYVLIVTTILKITSAASAQGRKKPFPACALYLTVVIVHHGCTSFI